jgi:hypothetical protein
MCLLRRLFQVHPEPRASVWLAPRNAAPDPCQWAHPGVLRSFRGGSLTATSQCNSAEKPDVAISDNVLGVFAIRLWLCRPEGCMGALGTSPSLPFPPQPAPV